VWPGCGPRTKTFARRQCGKQQLNAVVRKLSPGISAPPSMTSGAGLKAKGRLRPRVRFSWPSFYPQKEPRYRPFDPDRIGWLHGSSFPLPAIIEEEFLPGPADFCAVPQGKDLLVVVPDLVKSELRLARLQ
jgi:hypothetical protein